ncbi:MAG: putative sugar O-methyltransferase [Vicinamibacterales bacterium]
MTLKDRAPFTYRTVYSRALIACAVANTMTKSSKLWEEVIRQQFASVDDEFLSGFRAPEGAQRFVAWSPYERSSRYLKFLLFAIADRQTAEFFDAYRKIGNCAVGNPLSIRYSDCDLNADYLAAVEEWLFLLRAGGLDGVERVAEIGAGFGRTCHTLMRLASSIREYTIIDLEPMLNLSRAYLQKAAPDLVDRVRFVSSLDGRTQDAVTADLVINIDSFQEMPPPVIDDYMRRIVAGARSFYCKNPVGKYLPGTVGLPDPGPHERPEVFELGYCRGVVDIFDDHALREARIAYLEAYRPSADRGVYTVAAAKPMEMFAYYHHALYVRP